MMWSESFLNERRKDGDQAAGSLIAAVFAQRRQPLLYQLLALNENDIARQPPSEIQDFLIARKAAPAWFDHKRLKNGQRIFQQYALEIMALLGAKALPYCYAASPGNKALYLSDKMRNNPGKRLLDTAAFVIAVMTPGRFDTGQNGHIAINKVRLIHAVSRHYIRQHPEWDIAWGLPINQEDMAGTNLAFSYIILLGLQQSGLTLPPKEKEDFIFAWRYIGYLLHIDELLLPTTFAEARLLANVIQKRHFKKTHEGAALTAELLQYYRASLPSWQGELVTSHVKGYVGPEVAHCLGLTSAPARDALASMLDDAQALGNMLSIHKPSYNRMLAQHIMLKTKFSSLH